MVILEAVCERERDLHEEKLMDEYEETNTGGITSSYIKGLVSSQDEEAVTGKPGSNHKQRRLWPEFEDGNSTDDEAEQEEENKMERSREVGENSNKEIIKELKKIQRQNTITHYLLTASILVTLAWQLSEFSLIFRIKQRFNNPLKSIAGAFKGLLFHSTTSQNNDHNHNHPRQVIPPTYLPGLKIPDLPGFDASNDEDDD